MKYERIIFKAANGRRMKRWVQQVSSDGLLFYVVTKEGERTNEVVLLGASDLIERRAARMNTHYGELELLTK